MVEKKEKNVGTREDFFDKFLNFNCDSNLRDYIFRGVSSSAFSLFPWALREKSQETLSLLSGCAYEDAKASRILEMECRAVYNFYSYANEHGLPIPGIDELMSHTVEADCIWKDVSESGIIPERYSEIFALAQHYRVPTHFLDWSWDPHVALWFAAKGVYSELFSNEDKKKMEDEKQNLPFSVWVMNKKNVQKINALLNKTDEKLRFVTPPYSNNPNLHAQKGILTYYPEDTRAYTLDSEGYYGKSLDEIVARQLEKLGASSGLSADQNEYFKRYDFEQNDCLDILSYLLAHGYDECTIMPGFHSICVALQYKSELGAKLAARPGSAC